RTAERDALAAELADVRRAASAAEARAADLAARTAVIEADRDAAQRRAGQLADQVSDLATALARLGTRTG
ncbi:hypothetical protein FJ969_002195, partial [Micromonospora sp. XM-20-01]|nr:hypothetical protein [Micromonospora sp. XM-20-01]